MNLSKNKNLVIFSGIFGAAAIGAGIFFGVRYYRDVKNEKAQMFFSKIVGEYQRSLNDQENPKWQDVEKAIDTTLQRFSGTIYEDFLKAYKSKVAYWKNDINASIKTLEEAVKDIPKDSPFYYLYSTYLALMKFDSIDATIKEQGLELLKKLSNDMKNPFQDMALYYLGLQAWSKDDLEMTKFYWKKLAQSFSTDSQWAQWAQVRLELL